jgi:hypothetical protein
VHVNWAVYTVKLSFAGLRRLATAKSQKSNHCERSLTKNRVV